MRNLKRVLALALAMVMILGMMVIGSSAAAYSDAAAISTEYADAVEILSGMGVFKGTGAGFAPKQILTRAEASALVYRVITGDVKDAQVKNYDYASLKDVKAGEWFTGYVTYANNGGYIKGDDAGNFNPYAQVTGIQVMAIMLRAAGYGQNGEYEGAAWKDNILTDAKELGITGKISVATLDAPASRELVAQLLFNAIYSVKMVAYSPLLAGYIPLTFDVREDNKLGVKATQTLGEKVFGLAKKAGEDMWGRPCVYWYNADSKLPFMKSVYATIEEIPVATYTTAVSDCDLAVDLGLKATATAFPYWTNGLKGTDKIDVYGQKPENGGQGVQIEVYEDRIVRIDTYLAEVGTVYPEKTDRNGHVVAEAYSDVDVICSDITETTMESVDYKKGDMILVNVNHTYGVLPVQVADAFVGTQTTHFWNSAKHEIEDVVYFDAEHFHLDPAEDKDGDWTWYLDQFGNIIGDAEIVDPSAYGVIKSIQWINVEDNNGYAKAYIVDMNGDVSVMQVVSINGDETAYDAWGAEWVEGDAAYVSANLKENYDTYCTADLYEIKTVRGGVALTEVTEITDATVKTAVPVITGTPKDVLVDNDTMYLIRVADATAAGGYTWITAVGYENVANYTDAASNDVTVDYVNLDKDAIAEYVYITGKADSANAWDYVYITNDWDISGTLKTIRGYKYYTVTGVVRADGNTDPLYVKGDVAAADLVKFMTDNVDKLFVIKTVDGKAETLDDLVEVGYDKTATTQNGNVYAYYAGTVTTLGNGMIVTEDGFEWNVNTTTTVANVNGKGTISDLTVANLKDKFVYVVGYTYGNTHIAKAIFITETVATTSGDAALANAQATAKTQLTAAAANIVAYWNGVNGTSVTVADEAVKAVIDAQLKAIDDATSIAAVKKIIDAPLAATQTGYAAVDAAAKAATEAAKKAATEEANTVKVKDTTELVAALANYEEGNVIVLAEGMYQITTNVNLTKDVTIRGTGVVEIYSSATINAQSDAVVLENLTFITAAGKRAAETTANCGLEVKNCVFTGDGYGLYNNPGATLKVTGCTFDALAVAIGSECAWAKLTITGNDFTGCTEALGLTMSALAAGETQTAIDAAMVANNTGVTADAVNVY